MSGNLVIRQATVSDAAGIARVHVQAWRETYAHLLPEETLADQREEPRAARWREKVGDDTTDVWVALDEDAIVGWASASPGRDSDAPHPLELEGIYVLADHYGTGAGQALLDAIIGTKSAYLWMAADNPRAAAFYRRNGFAHDGTVEARPLAGTPISVVRLVRG
jgi:L-amino acid N-acyltransferase YncA